MTQQWVAEHAGYLFPAALVIFALLVAAARWFR